MDANFSVAVHLLILVSEADRPLSSREIAQSAGVNASLIRKLAGSLKKAGLITGRRGVPGFSLCREPEKISLRDIYDAVYETDSVHLFTIHKNPNDACMVGRHIQPVLKHAFRTAEQEACAALQQTSLTHLITAIKGRLSEENQDTETA